MREGSEKKGKRKREVLESAVISKINDKRQCPGF